MGFNESPIFVKVSLCLNAVGLLFDLIGFSTSYWTKFYQYHSGLWSFEGDLAKITLRKRRQADGDHEFDHPEIDRRDHERDSPDHEQMERDEEENARHRNVNNNMRAQPPPANVHRTKPKSVKKTPVVRKEPDIVFHEDDTGNNDETLTEEEEGWFEATQAFETLGFIAAIAALVLIILYIFVPQTSGKKIVFILSMLACFAAAGCIILGIIIYGSKVEHNLSWSFALCTIAGIIFGVSGVLLLVDMLKR